MLTRELEDCIDIQVDNRSQMDQEIDAAVEEVMQVALCSRTGGRVRTVYSPVSGLQLPVSH